MAEHTQIWPAPHGGGKTLGGRVRRTVIDIDDLIGPAAVERGGDFLDQRDDIFGLVADGNDNGNCRGFIGRRQIDARRVSWPVALKRPARPLVGPASYGAGPTWATLFGCSHRADFVTNRKRNEQIRTGTLEHDPEKVFRKDHAQTKT